MLANVTGRGGIPATWFEALAVKILTLSVDTTAVRLWFVTCCCGQRSGNRSARHALGDVVRSDVRCVKVIWGAFHRALRRRECRNQRYPSRSMVVQCAVRRVSDLQRHLAAPGHLCGGPGGRILRRTTHNARSSSSLANLSNQS